MTNDLEEKGRIGEADLHAWLKENGLSYLYVSQDLDTFAPLFVGNLKRPDFLVLLESVGLIAVDAKNCTRSPDGRFTLQYEEELRRVVTFERIFRIPVWYAYRAEESGRVVWYWISALRAIEVGELRVNGATGKQFVAIKLQHFERIEANADLGKLYTHRLPGLGKISPPLDATAREQTP